MAIVLAGGKGVRMKSELPKVLHPLMNRPLIQYVIDSLASSGVGRVIVVVGYKGDEVIKAVGTQAEHVWQHQQLGTGHAVMQAEKALRGFSGRVIVACGDVPLIKPETFRLMIGESEAEDVKAVVLTMELDDPTGYGRIVKNDRAQFIKIVEEKDADPSQKKIREINTGTYIFDKEYLFNGLTRINTDNAQGEYYLPDVLQHVISSGHVVKTLMLGNSIEGRGVNSMEELQMLEKYV